MTEANIIVCEDGLTYPFYIRDVGYALHPTIDILLQAYPLVCFYAIFVMPYCPQAVPSKLNQFDDGQSFLCIPLRFLQIVPAGAENICNSQNVIFVGIAVATDLRRCRLFSESLLFLAFHCARVVRRFLLDRRPVHDVELIACESFLQHETGNPFVHLFLEDSILVRAAPYPV
ncbi:UNVERIFIED_CONTAM: hypothetical protein PYX00_003419 [Menopon gallinae]|uniref:Uncharacterized protein n=1 Tax=Menopon gallinae TaxID=328185 RepID=A0AAW2I0K1_9NEOP